MAGCEDRVVITPFLLVFSAAIVIFNKQLQPLVTTLTFIKVRDGNKLVAGEGGAPLPTREYVCESMCVCERERERMCVCVRERERMCVCVCVCEDGTAAGK